MREKLIGREPERQAISGTLDEHQSVMVAGGAGVAKSQLAAEWTLVAGADRFWMTARDSPGWTLAVPALVLGVDGDGPEAEVIAAVRRELDGFEGSGAVWVVDDAIDLPLCVEARDCATPGPRISFTTRDVRRGQLPHSVGWVELQRWRRPTRSRCCAPGAIAGPRKGLIA